MAARGRPKASEASERLTQCIHQRLFEAASKRGMSNQDLADEAGLEYETVRRLRRPSGRGNRSGSSFITIALLAEAVGLNLQRLWNDANRDRDRTSH